MLLPVAQNPIESLKIACKALDSLCRRRPMKVAVVRIYGKERPEEARFTVTYEKAISGAVNRCPWVTLQSVPCFEFPIDHARNCAIRDMLRANKWDGAGFTHVLFQDTDHTLEPDTYVKLFTRALFEGKGVIGALTFAKTPPYRPIVRHNAPGSYSGPNGPLPVHMIPMEGDKLRGLVRYDATGTAALLIDVDILERIAAAPNVDPYHPWFKSFTAEWGNRVSEDIYFCMKVQEAGESVWVDMENPIGHIGRVTVDKATSNAACAAELARQNKAEPHKRNLTEMQVPIQ